MDLADGLETGSPFLCLFSLDLVLPLWVRKPTLRRDRHRMMRFTPLFSPLSESSLLKLSFSEEIDVVCI